MDYPTGDDRCPANIVVLLRYCRLRIAAAHPRSRRLADGTIIDRGRIDTKDQFAATQHLAFCASLR
jgi:hypothetical protein